MSEDKIKWQGKMLWMGFIHQIDGRKKNKKLHCDFYPLFILINHYSVFTIILFTHS